MSNGRRISTTTWSSWVLLFVGFLVLATVVIIIGLVVFYLLSGNSNRFDWLMFENDCDARNKYLLSATAQVLGALLAIIFSLVAIATQSIKYGSEALRYVFDWMIIVYMFSFASSIIMAIWWIFNPSNFGSLVSVSLASLLVLSLPIYFIDVRSRLDLEWLIRRIEEQGLRELPPENL